MKHLVVISLFFTAVMVGCATPATPASTPETVNTAPTTTADPPVSSGVQIVPTLQEEGLVATLSLGDTVTLVAPGSVLLPEATEPVDPNQPTPQFETLVFSMRRGIDGQELVIELTADGTLTRDGVVSTLPTPEMDAVRGALNNLRIYDAVLSFTGPEQRADTYIYGLSLRLNTGRERSIAAMEAYTPELYLQFFRALGQLGIQPFPVF